ncbi:hypothetical protein BRE01_60240 [Brevibacillus reuszeri]|uniref:Uncharacterized protein n=1 Tax=Brevibacillus reuszeri TaxID=54915 RepID=A0A0K9YNB0_9BACL|nr:hypothetical protein [Brevibacillus reuszeri]KNB70228.1 hypothetical protein ADS79_14770 [Brevibacillus reuszeri]MED1859183.1 hypothetical protein [Brevibacillus reuszeri]GED72322.1 hypothetical protein BRE01_60240 [Brevibacillus reuszeri]
MQNKINDLINSESDDLKKLGWFLFDRNNGQNGLSPDELESLLDMLHLKNAQDQFDKGFEEGFNDGYLMGYDEGWGDNANNYEYDNTPTYVSK